MRLSRLFSDYATVNVGIRAICTAGRVLVVGLPLSLRDDVYVDKETGIIMRTIRRAFQQRRPFKGAAFTNSRLFPAGPRYCLVIDKIQLLRRVVDYTARRDRENQPAQPDDARDSFIQLSIHFAIVAPSGNSHVRRAKFAIDNVPTTDKSTSKRRLRKFEKIFFFFNNFLFKSDRNATVTAGKKLGCDLAGPLALSSS